MNTENTIETAYRELEIFREGIESNEYTNLYKNVENNKLREIFSILHYLFIYLFNKINKRLPTKETTAHFWAEPSRELIKIIDVSLNLEKKLKDTKYSFRIENNYKENFIKVKSFLKQSGGSEIPIGFNKIELYYKIPIFKLSSTISVKRNKETFFYSLKKIGEGSYANVSKYTDTFYNRTFVLKHLKKDSTEEEIERFKREYEIMSNLKSPYIVEVYNYNEKENKYIMEYMDYTLYDYIQKNNGTLTINERKKLILQILKAFSYLHSKKIFHRDISYTNILLKKYEDVCVVKISDFGLVKIQKSELTSEKTEVKGSLHDPELERIGFKNYSMCHEIYALTRVIFFIITGRTNIEKAVGFSKELLDIGLNTDKAKRFRNINEMKNFIMDNYK